MPQNAPPPKSLANRLSRQDCLTLTRIYQHPITQNLELRDVTALFNTIGSAEPQHNGEMRLCVGDEAMTLVRPHSKDMTTDEVILLRHFLDRTDWLPTATQIAVRTAPTVPDVVVIIDHAGARIHRLGIADHHHIKHDIDRKNHDADREETYPADQRFFANVAEVVPTSGRIVVIGHGKGQSNEANHLIAWLDLHRKDIHARIASDIVADLPNMTEPELLALAGLVQPVSDATPKGAS